MGASSLHLSPALEALVFGMGIVGAAFLLAVASRAAELYTTQGLALAVAALVTILPEYAVDGYFAWQAGTNPRSEYTCYTAANMTGANRLLAGLGWPLVALLFWARSRVPLQLKPGVAPERVFLGVATRYSFSSILKGSIALWDSGVLVLLFALYMWLSSRGETGEPKLVGPSAASGALPRAWSKAVIISLFLYAAAVILASAEPFAEELIDMGRGLGVKEFILVQWLAPLASESPELLFAVMLTPIGKFIRSHTIRV